MAQHICYCGISYACEYCGTEDAYICPTVNGDEDANLCPKCYDKTITEMTDFYDKDIPDA